MGIVKAAFQSISGALSDQFLEAVEPDGMGEHTVFVKGVLKSRKKSSGIISNGSVIHVYDNQFMILVDGGKIVDYTAEPGYFVIDNSSAPSLFNGQFGDSLKDVWERFKFAGTSPLSQQVYYINLQEIKGIKFGTRNPINYFDNFYNAELFLRAHGTYSVRITNPILFYQEAVPRNAVKVSIDDINDQYMAEFLEGLQVSINKMSMDGTRISYVSSRSTELSRYMADALDETWKTLRGIEVISVGIASISYDEESQKLINMRNQGAMMSDPSIREGYMQSAVASGIQAAGSNANGAAAGFMGVGMGMQAAGGFMGSASAVNMQQMQMQQAFQQQAQGYGYPQQNQGYGYPQQAQGYNQQAAGPEDAKAQAEEGTPYQQAMNEAAPAGSWTCSCGSVNTGRFCPECGQPKPVPQTWICSCGRENSGKFCPECGSKRPE